VLGVSDEEEAYQKLGASHIQDGKGTFVGVAVLVVKPMKSIWIPHHLHNFSVVFNDV
jgi:hypothetical protein